TYTWGTPLYVAARTSCCRPAAFLGRRRDRRTLWGPLHQRAHSLSEWLRLAPGHAFARRLVQSAFSVQFLRREVRCGPLDILRFRWDSELGWWQPIVAPGLVLALSQST